MADKAITELVAASSVTPDSLFVLQQDNTAKKLTAQVLENWLLSFAEGHGGIQTHGLINTEGLVKTYRFTFTDQTYMDFDVVDGRGIESVEHTSTNGPVDTYTITYNDGTTDTFTVTNGAKGDKGDRADIWVKYASQKPTASSHSFGDVPDAWIGIANGHNMDAAPTDWQQYQWFQWKGEKGDTGAPATLQSSAVEYQVSDSGVIIPSGSWSASVPVVAQGKYLWTRTTNTFNTGDPVVAYSVSRMGIDGSGSVSSVAGISPEADGNVPLTAENVGALPNTGGDLTGELNMNGQPISGLNPPTEDDQAANMGYVDAQIAEANTYTNQQVKTARPRNLLDNSDFTNPVNQRGETTYTAAGYTIDRWISGSAQPVSVGADGITLDGTNGTIVLRQRLEKLKDGIYTFAIKTGDFINIRQYEKTGTAYTSIYYNGAYTGGYIQLLNNTYPEVQFRANAGYSVTVEWAALYEGEYTAETLPEYQPKGYGAELAECQRYFYQIEANWKWIASGVCTSATQAMIPIKLPTAMRINPTVTIPNPSLIKIRCGSVNAQVPSAIAWNFANDLLDIIQMESTVSGATSGAVAVLYFDKNGVIQFSADL